MASPHWTICAALETHLTTWAAANWSAALVSAQFHLERMKILIGDANPTVIGIMPLTVEEDTGGEARRFDSDTISVAVNVISRLEDLDLADLVDLDSKVADLRRRLQAIYRIPIGSEVAERERVSLITTFDHDSIGTSELWISQISCDYSFDAGEITEVSI